MPKHHTKLKPKTRVESIGGKGKRIESDEIVATTIYEKPAFERLERAVVSVLKRFGQGCTMFELKTALTARFNYSTRQDYWLNEIIERLEGKEIEIDTTSWSITKYKWLKKPKENAPLPKVSKKEFMTTTPSRVVLPDYQQFV